MREYRNGLAAEAAAAATAAADVSKADNEASSMGKKPSAAAPVHGSGEPGGVVDKLDVFHILR